MEAELIHAKIFSISDWLEKEHVKQQWLIRCIKLEHLQKQWPLSEQLTGQYVFVLWLSTRENTNAMFRVRIQMAEK